MNILYAADTHVHPAHLERLLKAAAQLLPDAVIIGGDLIPSWKGSIAASIEPHKTWVRDRLLPRLREFREKVPGIPVLLDLGNDDIWAARPLLEQRIGGDLGLLHKRIVKLGDEVAVAGYMNVNPTPFLIKDAEKPDCRDRDGLSDAGVSPRGIVTLSGIAEPYTLNPAAGSIEDDLDDLSRTLQNAEWSGGFFLFVSHVPPRNTALDAVRSGLHVGSLAVRRFIERWSSTGRLIATLHGHIHESPWESGSVLQHIGSVPCFNVGQQASVLRALMLDTRAAVGSARLVTVGSTGEVAVHERDEWF